MTETETAVGEAAVFLLRFVLFAARDPLTVRD